MKQIVSIVAVSGCIVAGWVGVAAHMAKSNSATKTLAKVNGSVSHFPYDSKRRDLDVANHERQVKGDPQGAIGWAFLSTAYLSRSRETDSFADAVKAEQAARHSLKLRVLGNLGAQAHLVNSLLQQHKFLDALDTTESALKIWGNEPTLNELHADILIEVGRYDDAAKVIHGNAEAFAYAPGKAVVAHLLMAQGHPDQALKVLTDAYQDMDSKADAPSDAIAWYQEKMAECLASMGRTHEAEVAFHKSLDLYPRDYKAYANLAKISMGKGDWASAALFGNKSNEIAPMPDILAIVGDAEARLGHKDLAEKQYLAVVELAGKPSGPADGLHEFAGASGGHGHTLDRQYAMFCADHNRDLDGGYACALRELQARKDVYAFDTMAWVCFKRGDVVEAKEAIDRALKVGTLDAQMMYHAGCIYAAAKRPAEATKFYLRSVSINPDFNLLEAQDARKQGELLASTTGHQKAG